MTRVARKPEKSKDELDLSISEIPGRDTFRKRLESLTAGTSVEIGMTITPMMAEVMLERNTGNRAVTLNRVKSFADAMKAGGWHVTGEAIIFSRDGVLNDGQHRLKACVNARVPFRSDVRFGVDREAFKFTDIGGKRTNGDVLSITGEKNPTVLAGAIRLLSCMDSKEFHFIGAALPPARALEILAENPGLRESVLIGKQTYHQFKLVSPSVLSFCHYAMSRIDADAANRFMDDLAIGTTDRHDAVFILRKHLINNGTKRKIMMPESAALIFKAWNRRRTGDTVTMIRWQTGGSHPEAFPLPR